jgi:organic radical activating enzyme
MVNSNVNSNLVHNYIALEHAKGDHNNYVVVNWCTGNICNFSCSYCPEGLHDGSVAWPDVQMVIEFCKKAIKHFRNKKLYFEFTGGEVTLWKELPVLLDFLKKSDCRVGIISNGSRSEAFWQKILPLLDHVCLSFHPESSNADHFFKIVEMCSKHIRTHANFMMHPQYFVESLTLAYKVKDLEGISIAIQPLTDDMGADLKKKNQALFTYTKTQNKVIETQNAFLAKQIKNNGNFESYRGAMSMVRTDGSRSSMAPQRFIAAGTNSWEGWSCHVGLEQIVVDTAGDIFRGWCKVKGKIGHISDKTLRFPVQPVICDKSFCHCNLDIMTTKTKLQKLRAIDQAREWLESVKQMVFQ